MVVEHEGVESKESFGWWASLGTYYRVFLLFILFIDWSLLILNFDFFNYILYFSSEYKNKVRDGEKLIVNSHFVTYSS